MVCMIELTEGTHLNGITHRIQKKGNRHLVHFTLQR